MKTISVIIPLMNSLVIDHILLALRQQHRPMSDVEILVAGIDTPGLVREDELVRFIPTNSAANGAVNRLAYAATKRGTFRSILAGMI
jgi:hypothetical protein